MTQFHLLGRSATRLLSLPLLFVVLLAADSAAQEQPPESGVVPPANPLQAAQRILSDRSSTVWAMKIVVDVKQNALASPELLRKYLNQVYLRKDSHTFAYKRDMRFLQIVQPGVVESLGDEASLPVPYSGATPESIDRISQIRKEKENVLKLAQRTPHAASYSTSSKIELPERETWAYAGGAELRHLAEKQGEVFSINEDHYYTRPFNSEYLDYTGISVTDPAFLGSNLDPHPLALGNDLASALAGREFTVASATEDRLGLLQIERVTTHEGQSYIECFTLSPQLGYLPISRVLEGYPSRQRVGEWTYTDPVSIAPQTWIYGKMLMKLYAPLDATEAPRTPLIETLFTLDSFAINDEVPDELFQLSFPPGTRISDFVEGRRLGRQNKILAYTMPATGEQLDDVIHSAVMGQNRSSGWRHSLLIYGNIALAVIALGVIAWKVCLARFERGN